MTNIDTTGHQPYSSGLLARIVGFHFPTAAVGGLPVYIAANSGLTLTPVFSGLEIATISFWFRVSQAAMDAAYNSWNTNPIINYGGSGDLTLIGIIPLVTWGKAATWIANDGHDTNSISPSFIGLSAAHPSYGNGPAWLAIRFQGDRMGAQFIGPSGGASSGPVLVETSDFFAFGVQDATINYSGGPVVYDIIRVTPDVWHHLIVSWAISGTSGKFTFALDGKGYHGSSIYPSGANVPASAYGGPGGGIDDILTNLTVLGPGGEDIYSPTYTTNGFEMSSNPFGTITPIQFSSYSSSVDMAELQVFIGLSDDVTDPTILTRFITDQGTPADPKTAETWFGQKQTLLLHPARGWTTGKQSGALVGDFARFGTIMPIAPDPQIGS
jgi:hypothetical protein